MTLTPEQQLERGYDRGETAALTEVSEHDDGWDLRQGHSGFFLRREQLGDADPPRVGDIVTLYTHRGSMVRGMDLRGEPLYYKTDEELDAEHEAWLEENAKKKREAFEQDRERLHAEVEKLPDVFRRRIEWFRENYSEGAEQWDIDFLGYEMSSCRDAVLIAEAADTATAGQTGFVGAEAPALRWIRRFAEKGWEEQLKDVPDLYDGHSGNSFGMAVRLAAEYVHDPELVFFEHGALTPLVGCDGYGCAHPRPGVDTHDFKPWPGDPEPEKVT